MTDKPSTNDTEPTPDELREQAERTRDELGKTVEGLAAKADVKGLAQEKAAEVQVKAAEVKERIDDKAAKTKIQLQDCTRSVRK